MSTVEYARYFGDS